MREMAYDSGAGTPFDWPPYIGYGRAPYASVDAGPFAFSAGSAGVAVGAFGWVDPDSGRVSNADIPGGKFGLVLPQPRLLDPLFTTRSYVNGFMQIVLRPGMPVVLAAVGDFLVYFPQGGRAGSQVYADSITGLPYATPDRPNAVATNWTLMQNGGPGARLRISSFTKPFN